MLRNFIAKLVVAKEKKKFKWEKVENDFRIIQSGIWLVIFFNRAPIATTTTKTSRCFEDNFKLLFWCFVKKSKDLIVFYSFNVQFYDEVQNQKPESNAIALASESVINRNENCKIHFTSFRLLFFFFLIFFLFPTDIKNINFGHHLMHIIWSKRVILDVWTAVYNNRC